MIGIVGIPQGTMEERSSRGDIDHQEMNMADEGPRGMTIIMRGVVIGMAMPNRDPMVIPLPEDTIVRGVLTNLIHPGLIDGNILVVAMKAARVTHPKNNKIRNTMKKAS
jgi:hypothetical protein